MKKTCRTKLLGFGVILVSSTWVGAVPGREPLHPLLQEAVTGLKREPAGLQDGSTLAVRARRISGAYLAAGRRPPQYLTLMTTEPKETAVFSMPCFWHGEVQLGAIKGVASSRTGWLHGEEVVELEYDPEAVQFDDLLREAQRLNVAQTVFARNETQRAIAAKAPRSRVQQSRERISPTPSDDKYYSRRAPWKFLPLTPAQASRVNALLARRADPSEVLSPQQRILLASIVEFPERGWPVARGHDDFSRLWRQAQRVRSAGWNSSSP